MYRIVGTCHWACAQWMKMANFILVNNEKISIFTPSIITHYTVNSPCTLFILFCQISPYVIITWMSYSAHKSLPDCSIWVTKLLLIIVVSVVSKPSLTCKMASHFSSWIVQQLEVEVYIHHPYCITWPLSCGKEWGCYVEGRSNCVVFIYWLIYLFFCS